MLELLSREWLQIGLHSNIVANLCEEAGSLPYVVMTEWRKPTTGAA